MTDLQQVVLKLEIDYLGHPYFVTGNALLHAIADDLDYETQRQLNMSHGVFAPGQYGVYPDEHSKSGGRPNLGASCIDVEAYDDLFLHRDPQHNWLLDSRPRDALNCHDVRVQSNKPAIAPQTIFGKPADDRRESQTTSWYLHCYITSETDGLLPLEPALFDGIHLGGKRNYGYGEVSVNDTQLVDLDAIDYGRLEAADEYLVELVTPYVLTSEHPHADDSDVPWWWAHETPLRRRSAYVVEQRDRYAIETIDHGQVVGYGGDRPIETAKNGLLGIGTHSKYGYGELRVKPLEVDETPDG